MFRKHQFVWTQTREDEPYCVFVLHRLSLKGRWDGPLCSVQEDVAAENSEFLRVFVD